MTDVLTPPTESLRTYTPDSTQQDMEGLEGERSPFRKLWTRKECEMLEQNDLLTQHYELIFGEIIFMGQNIPHRRTVVIVLLWLAHVFGSEFIQTQTSIGVNLADAEINAPEPDAAALNVPLDSLPGNEPMPADVALLIEVSDSTLRFDLRAKARLYARAGIVEYWVADVAGRRFIVHRSSGTEGYADITEHDADAVIAPLVRPDAQVRVADLLPPVSSAA